MEGQHSHWEKYHTRIVEEQYYEEIDGIGHVIKRSEWLECICIHDGTIFHRVKVVKK